MTGVDLMTAMVATIRAEAAAQGLSMRALAIKSGLKPDRIKNYTSRGYVMPLPIAKQLATGLGMSLADLVRLAEERQDRAE